MFVIVYWYVLSKRIDIYTHIYIKRGKERKREREKERKREREDFV